MTIAELVERVEVSDDLIPRAGKRKLSAGGKAMRALVAWLLVAMASGCLSETRRPAADVTRDGGGDAADGDLCGAVDCDDHDACTTDWCDPESGQCQHDAASAVAPVECQVDTECNDGDPCTNDTCLIETACGVTSATCEHEMAAECAFGGCTSEGLVSVEEVRALPSGGPIKVGGVIGMASDLGTCSGQPSCLCSAPAALIGGGSARVWLQPGARFEDSYACSSTGCAVATLQCDPALAGVHYRVWGTGRASWEFGAGGAGAGEGGAVPAAMVDGIAVDDFCLETQGTALVGQYAGTLTRFDMTIEFDAEIKADQFGNLNLNVTNPRCELCRNLGDYSVRVASVETLDAGIAIELQAGPVGALEPFKAVLYTHRSKLMGRYEPLSVIPNGIAIVPGGTIELLRLPPIQPSPL